MIECTSQSASGKWHDTCAATASPKVVTKIIDGEEVDIPPPGWETSQGSSKYRGVSQGGSKYRAYVDVPLRGRVLAGTHATEYAAAKAVAALSRERQHELPYKIPDGLVTIPKWVMLTYECPHCKQLMHSDPIVGYCPPYSAHVRECRKGGRGSVNINDSDMRSPTVRQDDLVHVDLALRARNTESLDACVRAEKIKWSKPEGILPIRNKLLAHQQRKRQGQSLTADSACVEIPGAAGWMVVTRKRKIPPKENWSRNWKKREKVVLTIHAPGGRRIDGLGKLKSDPSVGAPSLKRRIVEFCIEQIQQKARATKTLEVTADLCRDGTDSALMGRAASTSESVNEEENDEPDDSPADCQKAAQDAAASVPRPALVSEGNASAVELVSEAELAKENGGHAFRSSKRYVELPV